MKLKSKGAFFARNKENDIVFIIYSLYMIKSYINSRTINHYVIYSYT